MAGKYDKESPNDVLLAIPPTQYLEKLSTGFYRTRISLKNKDGSVLGANLMNGRLIHFSNDRVGFAEVHSCTPEPTEVPSSAPTLSPTKMLEFGVIETSWNSEDLPTETALPSSGPSMSPSASKLETETAVPTVQKKKIENATHENVTSARSDNPQKLSEDTMGYDSMKFILIYIYATGLVFMLGVGLIVITICERDAKGLHQASRLSL